MCAGKSGARIIAAQVSTGGEEESLLLYNRLFLGVFIIMKNINKNCQQKTRAKRWLSSNKNTLIGEEMVVELEPSVSVYYTFLGIGEV